jgi:hypothetical protein
MTSAAPYDATAAAYNDSEYSQPLQDSELLQEGDIVRCGDNPDDCRVIGAWSDWLWLHSLHPRNLAPFTACAGACKLVRRADLPSRPSR